MKILVPSSESSPTLVSAPSILMGTSKAFMIYDTDDESFTSIRNKYLDSDECHLAKDLAAMGVTNVIVNKVCDPCFGNLRKQGIEIYKEEKSITIREVFQNFLMGGWFIMTESGNCTCPKHKIMEKRQEEELMKIEGKNK
ncbi:MAG: hypothetical protein GPJ54_07070 [Candidatus Heimdallarchaeota archaeon]|nr:hypothetical protein [Candidatus Heimdallarchaeota archaeon]